MRHLTREDIRIHALLRTTRSIAVVEPARQRGRPGRAVLDYLGAAGFDVIPVRADQAPIDGLASFAHVTDIPGAVDLVLVVGARGREGAVIDEAAAKGVEAVWLPAGRSSRAATERAQERGVTLVMDRDIVRDLRTWTRQAGKPAKAGVQISRRREDPSDSGRRRGDTRGWTEAGGGGGVGGGGGRAVLNEKKMVTGRPRRGRRSSRRGRAA